MTTLLLISMGAALLASDPSVQPTSEGRYCVREQLFGHTGRSSFPLGEFWMIVDVQWRDGHATVGFANQMPDSGEVLMSEPVAASVMPNGSLRFEFADAWGNVGVGKLDPAGNVDLEVVQLSSEGGTNITRNYGSYQLNRAACAGLGDPLR